MAYVCTKFEVSSISQSRDILEELKIYKELCRCRDCAMCFVSRNYKSDLQPHSRSLVFVPFDRLYV